MLFLAICSTLRLQLAASIVPEMSHLWDENLRGFFGHSVIFLLPHVASLLFLDVMKGTVRCDLRVMERLRAAG